MRYVVDLLDIVKPHYVFRIENDAFFTMPYQIKWSDNDGWEQHTINSGNVWYYWSSSESVPSGYPKIRFDHIINDGRVTNRVYTLGTFLRYFGPNLRDNLTPEDAYGYYFYYNQRTREIDLYRRYDYCMPIDANGDGFINLQDLEFVGSRIGKHNTVRADVSGNGRVDIEDLILVAGYSCGLGAPMGHLELTPTLTFENLRRWIEQAKQLEVITPEAKMGIRGLEQLLATVSRTQITLIPKETSLLANYPNPFNPETWIPYKLAKPAEVTVTIYAADGRLIRTLAVGHQAAGVYQSKSRAAYWDGRNALGEPVASGLYFYTLKAGDFTATRKMLIRK